MMYKNIYTHTVSIFVHHGSSKQNGHAAFLNALKTNPAAAGESIIYVTVRS